MRLRVNVSAGELIDRITILPNDQRAALKRELDQLLGSEIREHKSHRLPLL